MKLQPVNFETLKCAIEIVPRFSPTTQPRRIMFSQNALGLHHILDLSLVCYSTCRPWVFVVGVWSLVNQPWKYTLSFCRLTERPHACLESSFLVQTPPVFSA